MTPGCQLIPTPKGWKCLPMNASFLPGPLLSAIHLKCMTTMAFPHTEAPCPSPQPNSLFVIFILKHLLPEASLVMTHSQEERNGSILCVQHPWLILTRVQVAGAHTCHICPGACVLTLCICRMLRSSLAGPNTCLHSTCQNQTARLMHNEEPMLTGPAQMPTGP